LSEKVYDGLFILNSEQFARNPDEVSGLIAKHIESTGGEVLLSRLWDERRLAYSIKGHRRGTYWLAYFKLEPSKVKELTRLFQITDNILRFLIVNVDPRIVDAVVEHAKEGPSKPPVEEEVINPHLAELAEEIELDEELDLEEE